MKKKLVCKRVLLAVLAICMVCLLYTSTVGIIDSDYYNADNEGHIMARLINDGRSGKTVELKAGQAFMQGLFLPYGITVDDEAGGLRTGGFGSTNA